MTLKTFCIICCILCICGMVIALSSYDGFTTTGLNGKAIGLGGGTFAKMDTASLVSQNTTLSTALNPPTLTNVDMTAYTTAKNAYTTAYAGVRALSTGAIYDGNNAIICPTPTPKSAPTSVMSPLIMLFILLTGVCLIKIIGDHLST